MLAPIGVRCNSKWVARRSFPNNYSFKQPFSPARNLCQYVLLLSEVKPMPTPAYHRLVVSFPTFRKLTLLPASLGLLTLFPPPPLPPHDPTHSPSSVVISAHDNPPLP